MKRFLLPVICLALASLPAAAREFSHPDRIRYDGQCLTIDGRDVVIFSGSFHYFRCPPALWRERFRAIRAAGCNAVETYVPWNYHERRAPAGPDDFSQVDLSELQAWLRMAQDEFGFYTIIRPGPYICAEWDDGGYPRWLLAKKPPGAPTPWLRTDEPVYREWARHWMKAVCPVIAEQQLTRRRPGTGGVILVQIENEFDLNKAVPAAARVPALRELYDDAVAAGIDVPIFTCWTRQCRDSQQPGLGNVFDAVNCYPRYKLEETAKALAEVESQQPDAPAMISELQGGWFAKVGGVLSEDQPGLGPDQLRANTLLALGHGATVLNYYMLFGGTNFATWGARDQTTSYDYDAPIRESGGVGEKYRVVEEIGAMLRKYGSELARSRPFDTHTQTGSPEVEVLVRRCRDGASFVFVRNRSRTAPQRGRAVLWFDKEGESGIDYSLAPFEAKVLRLAPGWTDPSAGKWLPEPADLPKRPSELPAAVPVTLTPVDRAPHLPADHAPNDIELYRGTVTLTADQAARINAIWAPAYSDDPVAVSIDGQRTPMGSGNMADAGGRLVPGENRIEVLNLQRGMPNFGTGIDDHPGLRPIVLGIRGPNAAFKEVLSITDLLTASDRVPPPSALTQWYQAEFQLPPAPAGEWVPLRLRLEAKGDGEMFLNGHSLGRYWAAGPQRTFFLPGCWLERGPGKRNLLTMYLVPGEDGASVRGVQVEPYPAAAEFISIAGSR